MVATIELQRCEKINLLINHNSTKSISSLISTLSLGLQYVCILRCQHGSIRLGVSLKLRLVC